MVIVNIRYKYFDIFCRLLHDFTITKSLSKPFWHHFQNILAKLVDSTFFLEKITRLPKKVTCPVGQAVGIFHLPFTNFYS